MNALLQYFRLPSETGKRASSAHRQKSLFIFAAPVAPLIVDMWEAAMCVGRCLGFGVGVSGVVCVEDFGMCEDLE